MMEMVKSLVYLIDLVFRLIFLPFDFIMLNIIWYFYMDLFMDRYTYKEFILLAWCKFKQRNLFDN